MKYNIKAYPFNNNELHKINYKSNLNTRQQRIYNKNLLTHNNYDDYNKYTEGEFRYIGPYMDDINPDFESHILPYLKNNINTNPNDDSISNNTNINPICSTINNIPAIISSLFFLIFTFIIIKKIFSLIV